MENSMLICGTRIKQQCQKLLEASHQESDYVNSEGDRKTAETESETSLTGHSDV